MRQGCGNTAGRTIGPHWNIASKNIHALFFLVVGDLDLTMYINLMVGHVKILRSRIMHLMCSCCYVCCIGSTPSEEFTCHPKISVPAVVPSPSIVALHVIPSHAISFHLCVTDVHETTRRLLCPKTNQESPLTRKLPPRGNYSSPKASSPCPLPPLHWSPSSLPSGDLSGG